MRHYFQAIQEVFSSIRIIMSGGLLEPTSPEIKSMQSEAYDIEIPHSKMDRFKLKEDGAAVAKDYSKALEKKKLELQD